MLAPPSIRRAMFRWLIVPLSLGVPGVRAEEAVQIEPSKPIEEHAVVKAPKAAKAKAEVRKVAPQKPAPHAATSNKALSHSGAHEPVAFNNAPFPYNGEIPGAEPGQPATPFFNVDPDGRRFHIAPRGGKLYEVKTYSDKRSLLFIPPRFDPAKPAAIVLFLHGNLATLERDVVQRQQVPAQLEASGFNAVLVAPQLAVDALDSSAGRFWEPGFLDIYLAEAAEKLATRSAGRFTAERVKKMPVVIVAYSGGYLATAYTLKDARNAERIKGVILLDALFGEEPKFAAWIEQAGQAAFFVSAYSDASKGLNAQLIKTLDDQSIHISTKISGPIRPGDVVFQGVPDANHNAFVTQAWVTNPLQDILERIDRGASPRAAQGTSTLGADPAARPTNDTPPAQTTKQKPIKASKPAHKVLRTKPVVPSDCPADDPNCKPGENKPR